MHNSKPSVSVIMPAYNSAKYIGEAIDSVLAQTYPVLEIIVVDDGSTDDTRKIVSQYSIPNTQCIKYIYQENKGPAAARNKGIKEARGEYIAFLDSDDIWMPEKIAFQLARLEKEEKYSMMHSGRNRIMENGIIVDSSLVECSEGRVFDELLMRNFVCCSSVILKKSCFNAVGYFDENIHNRCEDYDMWLRIARNYEIGVIKQALVTYRVSSTGYNRSEIKKAYDSEKTVFLKAVNYYTGDKAKIMNDRLYLLMKRMGNSFMSVRNYTQAFSSYAAALLLICKRFTEKESTRAHEEILG